MTTADTPRPSADYIRELVASAKEESRSLKEESRSLAFYGDNGAADTIDALCAAVESLLEDRELLDWFTTDEPTYRDMERLVAYFNDGLPLRETIRGIRSYRRAWLKQAVGA